MKKQSNFKVCKKLIVLVKPLTAYMLSAVLLGLLGHLCASFLTVLGGFAILHLLGVYATLTLNGLFISIAVIAVLRGILHYGEQACNHYIAFKLLALLRDKVFYALRRLCPAKLEGKEKGNLIAIITADIELLEVFYAHTISPVAIAFFMTLIMSLFLLQYHWILALLALAAYCFVGIAVPLFTSKLSGDNAAGFREKSGSLSSYLLDSMRGLGEIIQYAQGKNRLKEMQDKTEELSQTEENLKRIAGLSSAVTNSAILIFILLMLFASTVLFQNGMISFDGVLIPVIALMSSFGPVIALANLGSSLQSTFAAGRRVTEILEESPVTAEIQGKEFTGFSGANISSLNFSYGNEVILSDFSLTIPQYKIIGIVGKSGCGKSTLLKLLMRFWKAPKRSIEISGKDISEINTANLREMESYVTQDTHLFRDSIESNLRIAKQDATHEEIVAACKKASIHTFISRLPQGYDTPVGELGDVLSGGERQRIGLARAFLHNAPFMLLDEPTSNLDSLNEAVILKSIEEERAGKTVVLISHRQSISSIADTIYKVGNGRRS